MLRISAAPRSLGPKAAMTHRNPWSLRRLSQLASGGKRQAVVAPTAAAAQPGPSAVAASDRLDRLFLPRSPVLLLERSVSERLGADSELWQSGCFQGEVYPDLPIATTWRDLVQRLFNLQGVGQLPQPHLPPQLQHQQQPQGQQQVQQPQPQPQQPSWFVCTVAAQCRSLDQLRAFILSAAGRDFMGEPKANARGADALLFVSGSHPARSLPAAGRWLQNSFDLLQLAATMREQGYLPPSLSLWAVENPMTTPVARLQQKVDAGAEVVLTQPPLAWERAERWMQEADVLRLTDQARVVVGVPMVSSAGNLDFWLRLCGARHLPESEGLLAAFPRQGELGKEEFEAAVARWNSDFIQRVLDLPGVAGLHVMPLTTAARRMTLRFLKDGTLPSRTCSFPPQAAP